MLRQLPLARRVGNEPDELQKQQLLEYDQAVLFHARARKICQVCRKMLCYIF